MLDYPGWKLVDGLLLQLIDAHQLAFGPSMHYFCVSSLN